MSETPRSCPFIGLAADPTVLRTTPDDAHRCFALVPPGSPDTEYQQDFCLTRRHTQCPFFQSPDSREYAGLAVEPDGGAGGSIGRRWLAPLAWVLLALLMGWVASIYLRDTPAVKTLALSLRPPATAINVTQAPAARPAVAIVSLTPDVGRTARAAGPSPNPAGTGAAAVSAAAETTAGLPAATVRARAVELASPIATSAPPPMDTATATVTPTPPQVASPAATPTAAAKAAATKVVPTAAKAASAKTAPMPAATTRAPQVAAKAPASTPSRPGAGLAPTVPVSACPDPGIQITAPEPGAVVSGLLELRGRAVSQAFAGYVVEFAPGALPDSGYEEVHRSMAPVDGGVLGTFVISALPEGTYTVSLRVLASRGDPPPPCRVVFRTAGR